MSIRATAGTGVRERPVVAVASPLEAPEVVSVGLTATAVLLLAASLLASHLRLDAYGLAGSLPVTYYLGLACLPVGSAVLWTRPRGTGLLIGQLVLFVLVVWLTPLVLEGTPRFRTSYSNYAYVDPIVRGLGLMPGRFFYHNWPAFPVLFGELVSTFRVPPLTLMGWFPALVMLAYLVPLGALLWLMGEPVRKQAPYAWIAGLWFVVAFDWTGQDYFSPQAISYLLFLCWALLLAFVALRRDGRFEPLETLVAIGLFALIVLTHVLTAMLAIAVLAALTVVGLLRRPSLVVTTAVLFIGWQVYVAAPFYGFYGHLLVAAMLSAGDFFTVNLANRIAGSPQHEMVATVRVAVALLAFAIGGLGLLRVLARRSLPVETRFALASLIGIAVLAPVTVYGGEMLIRVLLFSLPLLAVLVVRAFDSRAVRAVLLAGLVAAAPLQVVTHYGNELYDYVSPGEVAGYEYIADRLAPANVLGAYPAGAFLSSATLDFRNAVPPNASARLESSTFTQPQQQHWLHRDWPVYVAVSRGDAGAATLFYRDPTFVEAVLKRLETDASFRLVYRNADIAIFRYVGSAASR